MRSMLVSDAVRRYLLENGVREPAALVRLRSETATLPQADYQVAPEIGQLIAFLIETIGARLTLDIGTFTGYSALAAALALPGDGRVVTCDADEAWTDIARRHWREAGVAGRIDLRLGLALASLDALVAEGAAGRFDFALIDADKKTYPDYYERTLMLLRPGGLMAIDNTLWRGSVADGQSDDAKARLFRAFNRRLHEDERITLTMLPLGDGVTLARKR